ncbi:hypothetical protein EJ08DRAFT_644697, partial [Tothia fuscella]
MAEFFKEALSKGLKDVGKLVGSQTASAGGKKLFEIAYNAITGDGASQELKQIEAAIHKLDDDLKKLSEQIHQFELTVLTTNANGHANTITELYKEYIGDLKSLAEHAQKPTEKAPGSNETLFDRAKGALKRTGEIIRAKSIATELVGIHEALVGDLGQQGLLKSARVTDLKPGPRGFLNHYVFMRTIFLKYWVAQEKGIILMEWMSVAASGLDFIGEDSKDGTKGPISIARDNLSAQERHFNNLIGPHIVLLCRSLIAYPKDEHKQWIYSEPNKVWDLLWLPVKIYPVIRDSKNGYHITSDFSRERTQMIIDSGTHFVVQPQEPSRDRSLIKVCFALIGVEKDTLISPTVDCRFRISVTVGRDTFYLHFGNPYRNVGEYALISKEREWSNWRIIANETAGRLNFQFAKDDWGTQKDWWLNCHWGAKICWGTNRDNYEHTAAFVGIPNRDGNDIYQSFRIESDPLPGEEVL